jgi:hypothetical protein
MKPGRTAVALAAAFLLYACGEDGVPEDARKAADKLSGDPAGAAGDNPVCKLFRPSELEAYVGEPLNPGQNAAMGSGCQWRAVDGDGDAMVVAVPAQYAEQPSLAEGFREEPTLGKDGFAVPELGGWAAGAVVGDDFLKVSVKGNQASRDRAIALLKEAMGRRSS